MVSPVVFYSSSVGTQNTDPNGYLKTTQHLQDYYVETKDIPLGPFTEAHVGGYQYRHSGLNAGVSTLEEKVGMPQLQQLAEKHILYYTIQAVLILQPSANYSRGMLAKDQST